MSSYPFTVLQRKTLPNFKILAGSEKFNIIRNPKTNKTFFSCGDISGAVSSNFNSKAGNIEVVQVHPKELVNPSDSDIFWMIHNRAESTENVLETL